MSASVQGETVLLIAGGYEMNVEGTGVGERSADILKFDGIKKVWIREGTNETRMKVERGGHITIPITYPTHMAYLMGK